MLGTSYTTAKHVPGRAVAKLLHIGIIQKILKHTDTWHQLLRQFDFIGMGCNLGIGIL